MIVAGLSAGTVMSLSMYRSLTRYYLVILILPFTISTFMLGSNLDIMIAILIALFMLLLIGFSKEYHNRIIQVIVSKYIIEQTQKEKKVSEDNFSSIFKEAPIGVFTYDKDLIIEEANQTFSSFLDAPLEKLIGLDMKKLYDQSIRPTLDITLHGQRGFYEGNYLSKRHLDKDADSSYV